VLRYITADMPRIEDLGLPEMLSERDARYLQTHFSHARILNHWNVGGQVGFTF